MAWYKYIYFCLFVFFIAAVTSSPKQLHTNSKPAAEPPRDPAPMVDHVSEQCIGLLSTIQVFSQVLFSCVLEIPFLLVCEMSNLPI